MIPASTRCGLAACIAACCALSPARVLAHGSVAADADLCLIQIGYLAAHFKIYLPASRGHQQFCEDLPQTGQTVFIMEYVHRQLEDTPIEFRIIRNVTGKGRFARLADVARIGDLEAVTVFHQRPLVQPDVYMVQHRFDKPGEFVGIVTATQPDTGRVYSAVFPFDVGYTGLGYWPWIAGTVLLLQWQYWWLRPRRRAVSLSVVPTAVCASLACIGSAAGDGAHRDQAWPSGAGLYRVSYESRLAPIVINRMHDWVVHVETSDGSPVDDAVLSVSGGMPEHNHGLPTRPQVTDRLGNGDYLVEGMRFHMNGHWEIRITIDAGPGRDTALIPLDL